MASNKVISDGDSVLSSLLVLTCATPFLLPAGIVYSQSRLQSSSQL